MEALRVLIADDHRLMLTATTRALSGSDDLQVVAETNVGSKVMATVRESNPDVVLLDLRMPELDGLQCLARLREHDPDLCVILLTSYTDRTHIEAARSGGAAAYIAKTIDRPNSPTQFALRSKLRRSPSGAWAGTRMIRSMASANGSRWCCPRSLAAFRIARSGKSCGSPTRRSSSTSGTSTESSVSRTAPRRPGSPTGRLSATLAPERSASGSTDAAGVRTEGRPGRITYSGT